MFALLPALAATLALGAGAGWVASLLHSPLPWMIGPMLAVAAARVLGARLVSPRGGRQAGQWLIGTTLGLYFSPTVLRTLSGHGGAIAASLAFALALGGVGALVLRRVAGCDWRTAFFASVPGGATEMAVLAGRSGAAADQVALAHALRMVAVVLILPFAMTLAGAHGADPYQPVARDVAPLGLLAMLGLAAGSSALLARLRVPNAWMLGSLLATIALAATDAAPSAMPHWLTNSGQVLVGCSLGERFDRDSLRRTPRFALAVLASVALAISLSALFAWLLAQPAGIAAPTAILATAPGGIAEMCLTARVLQLGVPLVTAFHVLRVAAIMVLAPMALPGLRLLERASARD